MQHRSHDLFFELLLLFAFPIVGWAERAHPTRVWPNIAVKGAFVITRGFEEPIVSPINQRVERTFRAAQKFFDNDSPARLADAALIHHLVNRLSCRYRVGCND